MNDNYNELKDKLDWLWLVCVLLGLFCLLTFLQVNGYAQTIDQYRPVIEDAARLNGVDPKLIEAIIHVESGGNPNATGKLGEMGLLQLRPEYFPDASHDPTVNIYIGVAYLGWLKRERSDWGCLYWVSYNVGPYNQKVKRPERTKYFKKVSAVYEGELCGGHDV